METSLLTARHHQSLANADSYWTALRPDRRGLALIFGYGLVNFAMAIPYARQCMRRRRFFLVAFFAIDRCSSAVWSAAALFVLGAVSIS